MNRLNIGTLIGIADASDKLGDLVGTRQNIEATVNDRARWSELLSAVMQLESHVRYLRHVELDLARTEKI